MTEAELKEYINIKRERDQLRDMLDEIEATLYHPKIQHMTGMPSNVSDGNRQEDLIFKHIDLQERYRAKIEELAARQLEVEKAIDALLPPHRMLLRYRYIDGLTWEQVSDRIHYSWRQTHRLHREALQMLENT